MFIDNLLINQVKICLDKITRNVSFRLNNICYHCLFSCGTTHSDMIDPEILRHKYSGTIGMIKSLKPDFKTNFY